MKAIKLLMMTMVVLCITCIGCSKLEDENGGTLQQKIAPMTNITELNSEGAVQTWKDGFDSPFSLTNNWTMYGEPQPQWVQSAYGRNGLFDNNGPSPIKNFAVSKMVVGKGAGFTVEADLMIKIMNLEGTCVCPGIGISKELNPVMKNGEIETGISMRLIFIGANATWFPDKFIGNTWIMMEYITDKEEIAPATMLANAYSNSWHTLKIEVTPLKKVKFYCDNNLIWAPARSISPVLMNNKNVVLGYTSDGDPLTRAGVAYHDCVKVSHYFNPGTIQ